MILKELIEQRNKLSHDVRELSGTIRNGLDNTEQTEIRTKIDAMLANINKINEDINRAEQIALLGSDPRQSETRKANDERSYEERNKAANAELRSYLKGERVEFRDLTVAADGSLLLPVQATDPVLAQRSAGDIYDVVNHLRTSTGDAVRVPLFDFTADGNVVLDSTAWSASVDPATTGVTINVDGLRIAGTAIDNKLIQDAEFDIVNLVAEGTRLQYQRGLSNFAVNGNSSNFSGYASAAPVAVTTTSTTGFDGYANFTALQAALDPAYRLNAIWTLNSTVLGSVIGIQNTEGFPIFLNLVNGTQSGFAGMIMGSPVKLSQYQADLGSGNLPLFYGDFRAGYCLREVNPGIVIKKSDQYLFPKNELLVMGFARAGGAPTFANTTTYAPIQALKIAS
jgi:HK97 family phage major capsid protein